MSALGGAYRVFVEKRVEVIPSVSAVASPGGPVCDNFFRNYTDEVLNVIRSNEPDGVYLDLHGAMVTETIDDPEGELLEAIRAIVGDEVPVAISLDLHAYVTDRMLENADIIVACKENPHTDYHLAGAKASRLLFRAIEQDAFPTHACTTIPLIIGSKMGTGSGPLRLIHKYARRAQSENSAVLDISIFNTTSLVDVEGAGQSVTVTTDNDPELASTLSVELAKKLWSLRDQFSPDFKDLDALLHALSANRLSRPLVVGDQGDRVLAGAPGDGMFIAKTILNQYPNLRALVPVTDPEAVALAVSHAVGSRLKLTVGGKLSEGQSGLQGTWEIVKTGDGNFIHRGPYLAKEPARMGRTVLLRWRNLTLLVTEQPAFSQDPEAFESQGAAIADYDVIVSKSGYHFTLSFAGLAECVVADTPGISNYKPGNLPYRKRLGCYPEVDVTGNAAFHTWPPDPTERR